MRADIPTGTVTFLFTDVEGSTRLLHELGAEGYARALAEHRRLIRNACIAHDGVEVDTQGDAFFFAFPTAPGALAAAEAATGALASGPIPVRIGLHTGTPLLTDEGYVGDDVHFAARVAASSHGGQIVLSSATAELVELSLTDLGEHRLEDIEGPVPIFQLGEGSFPPLKTISNTNLPRPASSFVGRERELGEVLARIEGGARLLTLTGPGGSGKTRLALEGASSLVPEYKAGVFWIGLSALRDAALVTETVAQTLGAKDGLAEHIGEREMLLLLDNLEQVIEAAPELSSLLQVCPNLTLLVTSRELLRVQGEVEYPVPPLAEPEAVALFCERAQTKPKEIRELCARLDSLPLAVELAAARTKALSPAQILERLSQRLDLLKGGRDADSRQQTLRATIDWSYDLLSEDEQQLFARLSVFAGGCTLEATEEVAEADLDTLQSLVEKSLLRFTNERYWMLETIREYAGERLQASGGADGVQRRHTDRFLALARLAEAGLESSATEWLFRLDEELGNVRAALAWAISRHPAAALTAVGALWRFWLHRGYYAEGLRYLESAWRDDAPIDVRLSALRAQSAIASAMFDISQLEAASELRRELARSSGDRFHEAGALTMLSGAARYLGDLPRARRFLEEAIELDRERGDEYATSIGLANLAHVARDEGDYKRARELLEARLALCRTHGTEFEVEWALMSLGQIAVAERAYDEATLLGREALHIASRAGDVDLLPELLGIAAHIAIDRGRPEDGAILAGAASALAESLGMLLPSGWEDRWYGRKAARETLVGSEFEKLYASGHSLDVDTAIRTALASID